MNRLRWMIYAIMVAAAFDSEVYAQAVTVDGTPSCYRAMLHVSEEYGNRQERVSCAIQYGGAFAAIERLRDCFTTHR